MTSINEESTVDTEFYFQWHITEKCNKRCAHCYHTNYSSYDELSEFQLFQVLEKIENVLKVWKRRGAISLTGGEPWLRKNEIFALIDRFQQGKLVDRIDILTNGSLLSDEDCEKLAQKQPLLRRIQVSLEGASSEVNDTIRGTNSFKETIQTIHRMKKHGLNVAVMMTISHINMNDTINVLELLASLNVDTFAFERFIPEGQGGLQQKWLLTAEELKNSFEKIHQWGMTHTTPKVLMYRPLFCLIDPASEYIGAMCSIGVNALTIMQDGTLYPCRRLPIALGNILHDNIYDIWYKSPLLWQARVPSKNLQGKCKSCDFIPVCRGCRAMALAVTGDWLAEDPQCWKK